MTSHPQLRRWARLHARFDDVLMAAPAWGAHRPVASCTDADALMRALCVLCPAGMSAPPGFASASHTLAPLPVEQAQQRAWVNHQMLVLDGTLHMLQLGGAGRQRLHRLAIKLRELLHNGSAVVGLPWDCGWLNTTAAAQAQAVQFLPRRPTLMVAWQLPASTLASLQAALQQRSPTYAHPVRLWVLNAHLANGWAAAQPL